MNENEHPVYDMRQDDQTAETVSRVYDTARFVTDKARHVKACVMLIMTSPFLGFLFLTIMTSIFGGHIEGIAASIVMGLSAAITVGMIVFGILQLVKAFKK